MCHRVIVGDESHEGTAHMQISTIGIDLATNLFQIHGVDAADKVIVNRGLRRSLMLAFFEKLPPCFIGIEVCAKVHYRGRELMAFGHTVRLMPPSYVKPYVRRGNNDNSVDAAANCETVSRPSMRFVPITAAEQQTVLMLIPSPLDGNRAASRHLSGVIMCLSPSL